MSIFSYLLPKRSKADVTPQLLETLGLDDRLWDCLGRGWKDRLSVQDWPEGALVTPLPVGGVPPKSIRSDCHRHKSTVGDYVICWGDTPTPELLRRRRQAEGEWCELGDGALWLMPTVRRRLQETLLPRAWSLSEDGSVVEAVESRFEALWSRSASWLPWVLTEQSATGYFGEGGWVIASQALSVNYRVGPEEALLLRLWTTQSIDDAIRVAMDKGWYEQKKTDESAAAACRVLESLLHGSADSTPSTDPVESIS